jgi:hypothetical protein
MATDESIYVLNTETQYRKAFTEFLENYSIPATQRRRLANASIDQLRRFMMTKEDFGEWVWEKHIKYAGEPWMYHIKTFSFVKDELFREVGAIKIRVLEDGSHNMNVMNKYECYELDEPNADIDADEIYFVRFEDLDNEIYWAEEAESSEDEEIKAEVEADGIRKDMKADGVSNGWAEVSASINGDIANDLTIGLEVPATWTAGKKIQMIEEIDAENEIVLDTVAIAERLAEELEVR